MKANHLSNEGVISVPSRGVDAGKSKKRALSLFDKMKNVKNLASSIVSTVQDKVSKIDEVIGDPLLQVTGIKDKDDKATGSATKSSDKKSSTSSTKTDSHKKAKRSSISAPGSKEHKTPITWRIDKEVYEKLETKRKKQIRRCLQVQNYQYEHQYVQHKNSIIRSALASGAQDKSATEIKLFNNQLDHLTDYELMGILKKMSMSDKFKFRRVSKRFRNCINQIIQNEKAFALIERNITINFRLDEIADHSIDPVHMNKGQLTSSLIQNINKHMTNLNSIVIAFPIDFNLFLELIRRRSLAILVLCGPTFQNKHMNALPDYTVNLSSLNLDQCDISDKGLEVIVRECGKVLSLRLSHCNQVTGSFLEHLPSNFVCLELIECEQFKLDSWQPFLAKDRKQMTTFAIDCIPFNGSLLESMVKFDKLTTLRLGINKSSDYKFKSISMYTRLERLKVADHSNPPCFTDSSFNEIQRGCDRLTKLVFDFEPTRIYLTDNAFTNLSDNCAKIASIRLINMTNLTEKAMNSISKLKSLIELALDNLNLNDSVLLRTLPDFRSLQQLKIYRCPNVTNQLPEQLFQTFFIRSVWYYFSLKSNPKITIKSIDLTHKPPNVIFECN